MSAPRVKVIINLYSDDDTVKYTFYRPSGYSNRINTYYGVVNAFQSGSHAGQTIKYKNENGILKIESNKWKDDRIEQTRETRKDPNNWDETVKIFKTVEINLKKVNHISDDDRLDKYSENAIMMVFESKKYILNPGECITFGDINNPKVSIC